MSATSRSTAGNGVRFGRQTGRGTETLREKWSRLRRRRNYLVERELQFSIIRQVMLIFLAGVGVGLSGRYAVSNVLSSTAGSASETLVAGVYVLAVVGCGSGFVFLLALFLSHRIAGPAYKIGGALWRMAEGDVSHGIHLRSTDLLQDVAVAANAAIRNWRILVEDLDREVKLVRAAAVGDVEMRGAVGRLDAVLDPYRVGGVADISVRR